MNENYLVRKQSLTGLTSWINSKYVKQTGNRFTIGDVQQYISRGHLPSYLGRQEIKLEDGYDNVKLYKIVENGKEN